MSAAAKEVTIARVATLVAEVVGYRGKLTFDPSRPDGMPRKLLDSSRLSGLGWRARTPLRAGLEQTYAAFLAGDYRVQGGCTEGVVHPSRRAIARRRRA